MCELIPFDRHLSRVSAFDPFRDFEELERRFFGNTGSGINAFRTDVIDNGDAYVLEAELPGFSKENISLDIENDCLTITAERKNEDKEEKKNYVKRERYFGSFSRSFDVSGINVDGITASFSDGILKLDMPKKVETVPAARKLEIK